MFADELEPESGVIKTHRKYSSFKSPLLRNAKTEHSPSHQFHRIRRSIKATIVCPRLSLFLEDSMKRPLAALILMGCTVSAYAVEKTGDLTADVPAVSTPAVSTPAVTSSDVELSTPAAAITPPAPIAFIAPLQNVVAYHEKEIVSLQQLMKQWNTKVGAVVQRQKAMEEDVKAKSQKILDLNKENSKSSKREAGRVSKDIAQINKEISLIKKERSELQKDFAKELKEAARDDQQALKEVYQQAGLKVSQSPN
jgi:hypothetical protein